jgi:hypothetical protein
VPDLTGTVVAIIDKQQDGCDGVTALSGEPFDAEILDGVRGRASRFGEWTFNRIGAEGSGEG